MTKPTGKASVHPLAFPDDWDSPDSPYGFHCDTWLDHPTKNGHDWFSTEERARRDANAYAYRQKGTKENWSRYLSLGFFVFEDCFECDKLWADMEKDPLQVHRSIWYNFRFHIDQMMDIPPKLNAWAINVTRAYLSHFDPSTLYETDTLAYSWKTMSFMEIAMDVDNPADWIPVTNRRRSKSPPASLPPEVTPPTADEGDASPRISSPDTAVPPLTRTMLSTQRSETPRASAAPTRSGNRQISWSQRLPPVTTVREDEEKDEEKDGYGDEQPALANSNLNNTSQGSSTRKYTTRSYKNVATNDGTHRVTIRWNPPEPPNMYERDKKKLNDGIWELVCTMLPPEVGLLYRWESEDLLLSNSAQQMTASELRDFISPAITFLPAQHQIVFGLRIGFATTPGQWTRSAAMQTLFTAKQVDIIISNSTSTSGKMVTAGYVLFKAPNTTQISRYTQFLRSVLPDTAPYFDVVRYKKTPMDQLIPHLRIQCGEKHVTPLCQALLPLMTGLGSAMFLPRYALGTMTDEQIKSHFEFHDKWAKSLKAIVMSPQINHLDQKRTEYHEDGTTLERSTREWMSTILAPDQQSPALCDVVNGPPDHKAYLLVPSHYFALVQQEWRSYKSRLYPARHREARFRDSLPGLPDVIHIQAEIESQVSFLEQLFESSEWQQLPSYAPHARVTGNSPKETAPPTNTQRSARPSPAWPTPAEAAHASILRNQRVAAAGSPRDQSTDSFHRNGGGMSLGTVDDRSTESTHSLTQVSRISLTDTRFQELEQSMQRKLLALEVSGQKSSDRLLSMERQFSRIDDLDKKVAAVHDKLDRATAQMHESQKTQQHISEDMEAMRSLTAQQFAEMNQRLLSNLESQHTMSTTMLDLREHFEKMSEFMENLATKMEFDRKTAVDSKLRATFVPTHSAKAQRFMSQDSRSTGSASTSSSASKKSVHSTTSSTVYCSPEKKKLRSHHKDEPTRHLPSAGNEDTPSADHQDNQVSDYMELCTNLDEVFLHQDESQRSRHDSHKSPDTCNLQTQEDASPTNSQHSAPLDSQYIISTDLGGADSA